ncbi:MAG: hypothetical protein HY902_16830 [Deltaproteobacteria bacterium]|nr:hypothetical protein [Deltaproteobacteria bacterium]
MDALKDGAAAAAVADPALATATPASSGQPNQVKALAQCVANSKKAGLAAAKDAGLSPGDPGAQAVIDAAAAQSLAACKEQALSGSSPSGGGGMIQTMTVDQCAWENPECTTGDKIACTRPDVPGIMRVTFDVVAGQPLQVYTDTMSPSATADTVLYLMHCDDNSCTSGQLVGVDDDGNSATPELFDSRIEIAWPGAGKYMAVAIAYSEWRGGTGRIHAVQDGTLLPGPSWSLPVGGWRITCKELRSGDTLYVSREASGPAPGANPGYDDSVVLALSTSSVAHCTGNCGAFQFGDDTAYGGTATTLATRLPISWTLGSPQSGRVIVAPYHDGAHLRPQFMHVRRYSSYGGGWSGEDQRDLDGDGLTHELERELKTCDVPPGWNSGDEPALDTGVDVGIVGQNCATYQSVINNWVATLATPEICPGSVHCWNSTDSDHDGLKDSYELFAAPIQCAHTPSGPYRDAGVCQQISIDAACAPGSWCMVEPLPIRAGVDPVAQAGPDVRTFDIYLDQDYYQKSQANLAFNEPLGQHRLNAAQLTLLRSVFGTMPSSCWDGSTPATGCLAAGDWRHKVALHLQAGLGTTVGDDRFREELPTANSAHFARSQWFARFGVDSAVGPAFRFGGLGRYTVGWHSPSSGGLADGQGSRLSSYGDDAGDLAGVGMMAHEFGHQLTLYHPHGPGLNCVNGQSNPPDTTCRFDAPPSTAGRTCQTVMSAQTPVASLMSYEFLSGPGMLPLGAAAPVATQVSLQGCDRLNLRYSKGLDPEIYEGSLQEGNVAGAPTPDWQLRKLSQDLFCFNGYDDGPGPFSQYSFYATPTGSARVGPGWDGSRYTFNWDSDTVTGPEAGSYSYDVSGGKTDPGSQSCATDRLRDVNEWGRIVALSQGYLNWQPGHGMCLYADTFNGQTTPAGGIFSDFCGWGEAIETQNMVASPVNYPRGACVVLPTGTVGCAALQACLIDSCTSPHTCRTGATCVAESGACSCTGNEHCYSGECVAGMCVNSWGACDCSLPYSPCPLQGSCSADKVCPATVLSDSAYSAYPQFSSQPYPFLESAEFNGTNARIRLPGGANSRLESMSGSYENGFEIQFDFRHDGFDGETEQVVFASGAFRLTKTRTGLTESLDFQVGNQTVLSYPPRNGRPLQRGRWYRIVWSAKPGPNGTEGNHFVWVRPWDVQAGGYEAGDSALNCVRLPFSGSLAAPGDVWIGFDGGTDTSRYFKGRLDNVSILNYVYRAQPANCTLQQ